jgi:hypothetical protein
MLLIVLMNLQVLFIQYTAGIAGLPQLFHHSSLIFFDKISKIGQQPRFLKTPLYELSEPSNIRVT